MKPPCKAEGCAQESKAMGFCGLITARIGAFASLQARTCRSNQRNGGARSWAAKGSAQLQGVLPKALPTHAKGTRSGNKAQLRRKESRIQLNARNRERYATDPAFREEKLRISKDSYHRRRMTKHREVRTMIESMKNMRGRQHDGRNRTLRLVQQKKWVDRNPTARIQYCAEVRGRRAKDDREVLMRMMLKKVPKPP